LNNWQGGDFVYLELKKYNQSFIEQIEEAKDTKALLNIWEQMKAKSFLNYNVDIKKQDEHLDEFKALSLAEQKQHLCELLDKNQLYVNLSSLNDADFACTEEEKKVTKDFYQIKEVSKWHFYTKYSTIHLLKEPLAQVDVPNWISDNLKPGFGQRPYQIEAFKRYIYLDSRRFRRKSHESLTTCFTIWQQVAERL
jgi:hypothetical protein